MAVGIFSNNLTDLQCKDQTVIPNVRLVQLNNSGLNTGQRGRETGKIGKIYSPADYTFPLCLTCSVVGSGYI